MKPKYIIIHHSASPKSTTIEQVSNWHKNRNWGTASEIVYAKKSSLGSYCQYHYFLNDKGFKRGRKENELGWHCGNYDVNNSSIAICVAGNYEKEKPDKKTLELLKEKIFHLKKKYSIPDNKIVGHMDIKPTKCPGKNLIGYIKNDYWQKTPLQSHTEPLQCTKELELIKTIRRKVKELKNDKILLIKRVEKIENERTELKLKIKNIIEEKDIWKKKARKRRELLEKIKKERIECQEKLEKSWTKEIELNREIKELENQTIPDKGKILFSFDNYVLLKKVKNK